MLTVEIRINGRYIAEHTAVNTGIKSKDGRTKYDCDNGDFVIWHKRRKNGARELARWVLYGAEREK